jgi:tetratricopeptide (TPR) repeat protein
VALRDYNECDAAIPHFQKASELDPFMWIARGGEAICYMKRGTQEDYRRAIKLNRKTLETIEQLQPDETMTEATRNFHLHSVYERLADCLSKIDDINESVEACERAFTYNNRCYKCIRTILGAYHDAKRDEEVMKVLRSLNEPIEGLDYTRLSESLIQVGNYSLTDDYFTIFARAAFEWDEIPFAIEMYRNAAAAARKQQKPVQAAHLDLCLATLFDRYGHDSERAARIWERLVDTYHTTKGETEIAWTKFNASVRLARYCLKRSIEVGKGTKEAQRCGATLEKLAKVSVGSESAVAASNNATMLGAWYKLMGRDEDAHACFRVQVKEGIRMLSDNDPTNDFEAYWKLVSVLTVAGEEKTAMGLLWTMHEGQSDEDSEKEGDDHEREKKEEIDRAGNKSKSGIETKNEEKANRMSDDVLFICDGCLRPKRRVSIAICRYCYDTHFCQPCFALCKSAKLRVNICSSKHSWLVIEPRSDEERQANVAGMIRVEGENITVGELKRRLAAQWDL